MHNVWLIAKREYLERIKTKSFRVMTVLIPLLMIGALIGGGMASVKDTSRAQITIVAPAQFQDFALGLQTQLQHSAGRTVAEVISPPGPDTRDILKDEIANKELDGYLWVSGSAAAPPTLVWTPRMSKFLELKDDIASASARILSRGGAGSAPEPQVTVDTSLMVRTGRSNAAVYSAFAMFFIMYFVIMLYGMNVARSIIEEKTSRVFEVLLATIRPEEMMAGKVIGVGAVGLTQVGIWLAAALILNSTTLFSRYTTMDTHIPLSGLQILCFVVFFVLGYTLYSAIAAALGAMTNSEQELQQLNMFLALPMACCMFALAPVMANPGGTFTTVMSFIPFCTPLIMYMRIALGVAPAWQVAASIAEMLLCIWAFLWAASRIYRVGILMYGKKPNLPEILRWMKYS